MFRGIYIKERRNYSYCKDCERLLCGLGLLIKFGVSPVEVGIEIKMHFRVSDERITRPG